MESPIDITTDAPSEHEDYGRSVIDAERLRELKVRSDARGLTQLALHLTWIAITGSVVWSARESGWLIPAMAIHGIGVVYLFAALHETVHRTAFKTRWINDAVAWGCGATVILGPDQFRAFHFAHHRYTQLPDLDPELSVKTVETLPGYLYYVSGLSYWPRAFGEILKAAFGRVDAPFVAPRIKPLAIREARILLVLYLGLAAAVAAGYWAPALLWFIPMVLAQPMWRGWLLAEHTGCASNDVIYENTRTTYTNPLMRFFLWQMPYHVAHHAYPGIPFHALAETNELIRKTSDVESAGYLRFHRDWIARIRTKT